jgi:hypothetical protein
MKKMIEVTFFRKAGSVSPGFVLPPRVFEEMLQRWPQFTPAAGRCGLKVRVEEGSDLQKEIFDYLAQHGKKPCWKAVPGIHRLERIFQLSGENVFDEGDLHRCRYLVMRPVKCIVGDGDYLEEYRPKEVDERVRWRWLGDLMDGQYEGRLRLWVEAGSIYFKVPMGTGPCSGRNPCVDTEMRDKMIAQNFNDVYFRPVEIRGESRRSKPLWQLWTDRILPPVQNELVDDKGKPYVPGISTDRRVQELYSPAVLRCRKSDLDAMGLFDFALTYELWAGAPTMFVSKRVYEWFDTQGLLEGFVPLLEE